MAPPRTLLARAVLPVCKSALNLCLDNHELLQTIAEWSPEEYVSASNFPSSRLSGGVGAAGTSIRNPVILICWALFLLICVGFIVHTLIYHREWFVPARLPEGENEMLYPPSPRSIGSV